MEHQILPDRPVHLFLILLKSRTLHTAHGCSRGTESRVSGHKVLVVELTPADASLGLALEIIIEVFFMRYFLHSPAFQGIIVKPPAYVVVTPQIIEECIFSWKGADDIHLLSQQ